MEIQELITKAESGDAKSMYELAREYLLGDHKNEKEGSRWLIEAAEQRYEKAMLWLGTCYMGNINKEQ